METRENRKKRQQRVRSKRSYDTNKSRILAASLKWQKANPEKFKLAGYKNDAKKRCNDWTLSDEEAIELFKSNCAYCGAAPSPFNGIDRVSNEGGYLSENCVAACKLCNAMKSDRELFVFVTQCAKIAKFMDYV